MKLRLTRLVLIAGVCVVAAPAAAEPRELVLDPTATSITFELGAVLHSVEGRAPLTSGVLRFDDAGGPVTGEIVVDAAGATTDMESRDAKMHGEVLESARAPRIVFHPERLDVVQRDESSAQVNLTGEIELLGRRHPLTLPATLQANGDRLSIQSQVTLPYVEWGLRDVSTFVLRVDKTVSITIHAEGTLK